jgi:perosamine synthetase
LRRRLEIYSLYRELLQDLPGISFQPVAPWAGLSPWLFCILVNECEFGRGRDELINHLSQSGVDTRPFFIPLHTLPPFREASRQRGDQLEISDDLAARGINLPTFSTMADDDVRTVARAVISAARGRGL